MITKNDFTKTILNNIQFEITGSQVLSYYLENLYDHYNNAYDYDYYNNVYDYDEEKIRKILTYLSINSKAKQILNNFINNNKKVANLSEVDYPFLDKIDGTYLTKYNSDKLSELKEELDKEVDDVEKEEIARPLDEIENTLQNMIYDGEDSLKIKKYLFKYEGLIDDNSFRKIHKKIELYKKNSDTDFGSKKYNPNYDYERRRKKFYNILGNFNTRFHAAGENLFTNTLFLIFFIVIIFLVFVFNVILIIYFALCTALLPWIISIEIKEPETKIFMRIFRIFYRYLIAPYYFYRHKVLFGTFIPFKYTETAD